MSWPRPCPNCGSAIPVSPLGELEKRIAELEAELRNWKELGPLPCSDWLDRKVAAELRAEKAEAEVEGLKSFIRRIADTPERKGTAERLFEALERVA